jgi:hypothetical protein
MALLEALADSKRFRNDMKDVKLGQCKVFLLRRVAGKKPTADEEADTVVLEEADTISEALQAAGGTGGLLAGATTGNVFIRVRLPGAQPMGESNAARAGVAAL